MMYVFSGLNPSAIRSKALSRANFVASSSLRCCSMTNFSSSVIWKYSLVLNLSWRYFVKIHGTRWPTCTGPEGPLPVYKTNFLFFS